MGLFSFLKREKKPETIEIRLEDLPLWINGRKKTVLQGLDRELSAVRAQIDSEKHKFRANVEHLNDAQPGNDKIPERAKQIREDNRKSYSQKVMALVQSIKIPEDASKIHEFCMDYDKALKEFSNSTLRNYKILKEFFSNETDTIATNIRNMDSAVKEVQKIVQDSGMDGVNELEQLTENAQAEIQRREKLSESIAAEENEMKNVRESKLECERRTNEIEGSGEYKNYRELIENLKLIEQEAESRKRELFHSFSIIEAALKKYERLTLENDIVQKYLNDPVNALLEDSEMKIAVFAEKMKDSIADGSLELKDAKKDKILAELETMTKERFGSFVGEFREAQEKINEVNLKIKAAEIGELNELREKIPGLTEKSDACETSISRLSEELGSIGIDKLKAELSGRIVGITDERLRVC